MLGPAFGLALALLLFVLRLRGRIARLERQIRTLRELAVREIAYRRAEADDSAKLAGVGGADELGALGLAVLGDIVEEGSGSRMPIRVFGDPDGTTFGWLATVNGVPVVILFSRAGDDQYITRRVPRLPQLSPPPFVHRQDLSPQASLADALTAHRKLAGLPADAARFSRIATVDDALREIPLLRAQTIAWREAQEPAALLDADLRFILGKHHDSLAPRLRRKLGARVPSARTVSG